MKHGLHRFTVLMKLHVSVKSVPERSFNYALKASMIPLKSSSVIFVFEI